MKTDLPHLAKLRGLLRFLELSAEQHPELATPQWIEAVEREAEAAYATFDRFAHSVVDSLPATEGRK